MLKEYYPYDIPFKNTHVVDMTYLFGKDKLVLRGRICGDCQGTNALENYIDYEGICIDETLEVVEGHFEYCEDDDTVDISFDGEIWNIDTRDMQRHLVKVEIVDVIYDD